MELKYANPNGGNVVASNLINVNYFFENFNNSVQKQRSYVIFIGNLTNYGLKKIQE